MSHVLRHLCPCRGEGGGGVQVGRAWSFWGVAALPYQNNKQENTTIEFLAP